MSAACTCGRIAIGLQVTDHRVWHPDCPEHGTGSAWWNSPEQQTARAERRERLRGLQARARQARTGARTVHDPTGDPR
jgi:hypothetical protein